MKVWTYCLMRNEAAMLGYFLRHYLTFSDRIIIYDDQSDDNSPQIAASLGAEVRPYPHSDGGFDDLQMAAFASAQYKEARGHADWIIWVDCDEFLYHPYLLMTLGRYMAGGVTLPLVAGYAMYADAFPTGPDQIYDEIKTGVPYAPQNKPVVVNPALDVAWGAGKHYLDRGLDAAVRSQTADLKLLHYRALGEDWFIGRNGKNAARLSARNIQHRLGWQVMADNQPGYWEREQAWMGEKLEQVVP